MKNHIKIIFTFLSLILVMSCGLDNYDEPSSTLVGQIVYEGEPVQVRGTGEAVQLQLYQDGYELDAPIPVFVHQDGSFEALLFDGVYKLVTRDNNGPWVNSRDTTIVSVNGTTQVTLEVTPLFTVSDVTLNLNGNSLDGSFTIDQVVADADVEYAMLLLSETNFVDDVINVARLDTGDPAVGEQVNMTMDVSGVKEVQEGRALFARVGVRPAGADQAIYSKVVKVR